jgi:hypothetical protein
MKRLLIIALCLISLTAEGKAKINRKGIYIKKCPHKRQVITNNAWNMGNKIK